MDAELAAKRAAGYNPDLEKEAQAWIEAVTGESFPASFHESLKDGVLLCKYAPTAPHPLELHWCSRSDSLRFASLAPTQSSS